MNATATHLAMFTPDWNSLDSVRRVHSDLEGAALIFFALLVLFDILAHFSEDKKRERSFEKVGLIFFAVAVFSELVAYPYGQRNDTLSEQIIGSLDAKARKADANASTALTKSDTALGNSNDAEDKSSDAVKKAGEAQRSLGEAADEANRAQHASSRALALATAARQEADSFDKKIADTADRLKLTQSLVSARRIIDWAPFEKLKIGTKKVYIWSLVNEDEPEAFCKAIASGINDVSKIEVGNSCGAIGGTIHGTGVIVEGPNSADTQAVADAITQASHSFVVVLPPSQRRTDNLEIIVGTKPPFIVGNK